MGIRIYIEDDQGRQYSQLDWSAFSGGKDFPRVLISPDHVKVLEQYLQTELTAIRRIDSCRSIQVPADKRWVTPSQLLRDVKALIRVFRPSNHESVAHLLVQLERTAVMLLGIESPVVMFTDEYFQLDGFLEDLVELERFVYYLSYTKAKEIHVTIC